MIVRTGVWILLSAAWVVVPTASSAADVAQIRCPVEALNGTELDRLADHVRRQASAEEPAMTAFYRSVDACASRHGWSDAAARQAIVHNLAEIGQREARRPLEARGVDIVAIERALLSEPAVIDSARTDRAPQVMEAFYERLDPAVRRSLEQGDRDAALHQIGTFLLFRSAVEASRADFARE